MTVLDDILTEVRAAKFFIDAGNPSKVTCHLQRVARLIVVHQPQVHIADSNIRSGSGVLAAVESVNLASVRTDTGRTVVAYWDELEEPR